MPVKRNGGIDRSVLKIWFITANYPRNFCFWQLSAYKPNCKMIVEGNHSSRNLTAAFFTDYLYKWRGLFEAAVYRVGLPETFHSFTISLRWITNKKCMMLIIMFQFWTCGLLEEWFKPKRIFWCYTILDQPHPRPPVPSYIFSLYLLPIPVTFLFPFLFSVRFTIKRGQFFLALFKVSL